MSTEEDTTAKFRRTLLSQEPNGWVCKDCGSFVIDKLTHLGWHERVSSSFRWLSLGLIAVVLLLLVLGSIVLVS